MNESVQLFFCDIQRGGRSDKMYSAQLVKSGDGYEVRFSYGRRSSTMAEGTKMKGGPVSYEQAKKVYDKLVAEKTGEGYTESRQDAQAPTVMPQATQSTPKASPASQATVTPIPLRVASGIAPELLTPIEVSDVGQYIISQAYWLQEKRDGHRRMIWKSADGLRGINKLGQVVPISEDLRIELLKLNADTFLLDGELEGDKFIAYEALDVDGDIRSLPYSRRYAALESLFEDLDSNVISILPTWKTESEKMEGIKLMHDLRAEGIVIKRVSAPFVSGRAGQHMKLKFWKSCSARVKANHPDGKASVVLELLDGKKWVEVGNVSVPPKHGRLTPGDIVETAYLYCSEGRRLVQARFLGVRNDVLAEECVVSQLVFKQGVGESDAAAA